MGNIKLHNRSQNLPKGNQYRIRGTESILVLMFQLKKCYKHVKSNKRSMIEINGTDFFNL